MGVSINSAKLVDLDSLDIQNDPVGSLEALQNLIGNDKDNFDAITDGTGTWSVIPKTPALLDDEHQALFSVVRNDGVVLSDFVDFKDAELVCKLLNDYQDKSGFDSWLSDGQLEHVSVDDIKVPAQAFVKNEQKPTIKTPVLLVEHGSELVLIAGEKRLRLAIKGQEQLIPTIILSKKEGCTDVLIKQAIQDYDGAIDPTLLAVSIEQLINKKVQTDFGKIFGSLFDDSTGSAIELPTITQINEDPLAALESILKYLTADKAPDPSPRSLTKEEVLARADVASSSVIDQRDSAIEALQDGNITVEAYQRAFHQFAGNLLAAEVAIAKQTKDQMLEKGNPYFAARYRNEKKDVIARALLEKYLTGFSIKPMFSWSPPMGASREKYLEVLVATVGNEVDSLTQEQIDAYAADIKSEHDAYQEQKQAKLAGMDDPQTVDDYANILRDRMSDGMTFTEARMSLTPAQRIQYDLLQATATREKREAANATQQTTVRVAAQTTSGKIIETKHTKYGHDLFVVQLADRLDRDDYNTVNAQAKKLGGYYSSFRGNGAVVGFQFKDHDSADAFLKLVEGDTTAAVEAITAARDAFADDRTQSAVERLTEMAIRLKQNAQESLNQDRRVNTHRRARFAASAEAAANNDKAMAETMLNIVNSMTTGQAQFLNKVRQKTQIEFLKGLINTARGNQIKAKGVITYRQEEALRNEPPTIETVDYTTYPAYTAYQSDLAGIARKLISIIGTKQLGQKLFKLTDDSSTEYTKFAKENLSLVLANGYRFADGSNAVFTSKKLADEAIERSRLSDVAVPLAIKKTEVAVVLSPSEAIKRGIWEGKDKLITIPNALGQELVEKVGADNRKFAGVSLPWTLENTFNAHKKLVSLDLRSPAELRSALREFLTLSATPEEPDHIKQLERAMIGKTKDGLDFFPTPESAVQDMLDAAEIHEGMSVLEPSAGMGHIAEIIRKEGVDPDVVEFSADRRELLEAKGFNVVGKDFLELKPRDFYTWGDIFKDKDGREGELRMTPAGSSSYPRVSLRNPDGTTIGYYDKDALTPVRHSGTQSGYDRIVMNPPFSNRRDIQHVQHAYSLLKQGGRLVALMGEGAFFGKDQKATAFRDWLESVGGSSEKLADGTFKDPSLQVNTGANARMVVINKGSGGFDSIDDDANEAATSPLNDLPEPTEDQKQSGDYPKGEINISGLDIEIENPSGSIRIGISEDGVEWQNLQHAHYGYVVGTIGADGDELDVYVADGTSEDWQGTVYVISQIDSNTGEFDEHKCMIGFESEDAAVKNYLSNFSGDWQGFGSVQAMTFEEFKQFAFSDMDYIEDQEFYDSASPIKSVDANILRGKKSMNKVLLEQNTVHRAMYRNDLGWVDFVWGDDKKGVMHIFKRRQQSDAMSADDVNKMLVNEIVETIARGETQRRSERGLAVRINIKYKTYEVSLVQRKGSNAWMLTAFKIY